MNRANYFLVALEAVIIAGLTFVGADKPHYIACIQVTLGGRDQLYIGSPGAGTNAEPTICKLEFVTASGSSFIRYTRAKLSSTDQLKPLEHADDIAGANIIPATGGNTLRCHLVHGRLMPGGNLDCSFGLWQLSPNSAGVALRLQQAAIVSSYTLVSAQTPSRGVQPVNW